MRLHSAEAIKPFTSEHKRSGHLCELLCTTFTSSYQAAYYKCAMQLAYLSKASIRKEEHQTHDLQILMPIKRHPSSFCIQRQRSKCKKQLGEKSHQERSNAIRNLYAPNRPRRIQIAKLCRYRDVRRRLSWRFW